MMDTHHLFKYILGVFMLWCYDRLSDTTTSCYISRES